ncbi:MAG: DUF2961 domain-containing protein, partial [Chitinispirillaceae bacterium]|nr:DUF2961 domain-containing protein [Chitinispirillaceae bacterium]
EKQAVTAATLVGPRAITAVSVAFKDGFDPLFLRQCLLEIVFDDAAYPQVRVPLGDFFSGVPYQNPYWTLPVRITADRTMISRWCMPFRERAVVRFINHSGRSGSFTAAISTQPYAFTDNTMYFYARWRQDPGIVTSKNLYSIIYMADPLRDHPILHITGKGVHVGTLLHIWNRENAWWGEGDDKISLDDLPEPSFMGTGTEDYFGYAWSTSKTFSHAFHAQPFAEGFAGFVANARFHVSDPQPFTTSYRFDMEIQTAYRPTEIDFGRAVFFYALGTAVTDHDTLTDDDLFIREALVAAGREAPVVETSPSDASVRYDARRGMVVTAHSGNTRGEVVLRLFRADGRIVATDRCAGHRGSISTAALSAGVYIADASVNGRRCRRLRFIAGR